MKVQSLHVIGIILCVAMLFGGLILIAGEIVDPGQGVVSTSARTINAQADEVVQTYNQIEHKFFALPILGRFAIAITAAILLTGIVITASTRQR